MELNAAVLLVEPAAFAAGLAVLRVPVETVGERRGAAVAVMAAGSAIAAAAAGPSATGWMPLDLVLLAALGATAVLVGSQLVGSQVPSALLLVAALAAALGGLGSVALPLALAAVGLLLVSLLVDTEPLVDAAAGGLVAQAALRLSSPGGRGSTAVLAALILVPLLVAAARTFDPPVRRTFVRVTLGLAAFAVVGAIAGAVAAFSAVGPLRRGVLTASATIDATRSVEPEATATGLAEAGRDFAEARRALEAWWARPARAVPVVAQHWRVLRAAALSGHELAEAGKRGLTGTALTDVHITDGRVPLEQLAAIERPVADVAGRATAARRRLDAARSPWLVPPLADRLDTQLRRVRDIEHTTQVANRVLPIVPRLLGRDGPRRYFLAVQTPVEARASGGFLGNYGEIIAEDGRLSLVQFGRQTELAVAAGGAPRTLDAPEDFLARYGRFRPDQSWANVNLSPDFPTTAQVIASLYPQSGGAPIDGVIAVDPAGLAALLAVVGPVEVPSWPVPITAANALQTLLYDQYERYGTSTDQRVDFLGDVAQAAWSRLTSGELPPVPELMAAFAPAVRGKHMLFSSTRADEQRLLQDIGAAGRMAPVAGDFIGLVTQNAAGNKIDYFLRREVHYRAQLDPGSGRLQASVKVVLHNEAPADGIGIAFLGNELTPPLPRGTNKLYLSFYTPWELVGGQLDGTPIEFERATELGRRVYSAAVIIPPESTATLELRLAGRLPETGSYRLDLHRQPMVAPDDVTTTLSLESGWRTEAGLKEQTSTQRLESDVAFEVPLERS